ncbi:MAG: UDP-N-acetylmuramoyl-tripeptide--D-alanyl-D-alanine ligase [Candidatus Velamenicoccus archaeovorus]
MAACVGGRAIGAHACVRRVVIDSRDAGPGALFVALPGTRTDGHRFVDAAYARGAAGVLVGRSEPVGGRPAVLVADPGAALVRLAACERRALEATVVGITGSVGKTTTKDLAAAVLGRRFAVTASPASFNNQLGLPLTVLAADERTEVLVCEIGAGVVGEIASLCEVARPHVGIVTVVGPAHVETFGSPAAIARAKGELVESLPPSGLAILNADDPVVSRFDRRTRASVLRYGQGAAADVRAEDVRLTADARAVFRLADGMKSAEVELRIPGRHVVTDALAAAACGLALGVPLDDCAEGLGTAAAPPGRMQVLEGAGGIVVWNDAYNANPTSVTAALHAVGALSNGAGRIAVLGPMAELGRTSRIEHERIGRLAARSGLARLIAVGPEGRWIVRGAVGSGMRSDRASWSSGVEEALREVRRAVRPGDVVLVKASRAVGLDRLAEALRP